MQDLKDIGKRESLVGTRDTSDEGLPPEQKCQHCGLQVGWKHASFCGESRILHVFYGWGGARGGGCDTGSWWHPRCAASVTPRWPSVAPPASRCDSSHQLGHAIRLQKVQDTLYQKSSFLSSSVKTSQFGVVNSRNFKYLSRNDKVIGARLKNNAQRGFFYCTKL